MSNPKKFLRSIALLSGAGWVVLQAHAQLIPGYPDDVRRFDPRDLALLPAYCKYTQDFRERVSGGNDRIQAERWQTALGPGVFNHLHHYCYGLMKANRGLLLARTELARKHFLSDAVLEFDYVIERAPRDFVLLPEILARRGQLQLQQGQASAGLESLERAIEIKPDYWPPYAHASDYFNKAGDKSRAREWITRGIAESPDSPALQTRLTELQGQGTRQGAGTP